jgi:hypothetical protein
MFVPSATALVHLKIFYLYVRTLQQARHDLGREHLRR